MLSQCLARELESALRNLRYGTIQLVVHDANVVRIERIERIRLSAPARFASPPEIAERFRGLSPGHASHVTGQSEAAGAQAGLTDSSEAPVSP